jgi:hypothetical protein
MMHRIAAACRMQAPRWLAVTEATCGRICKLVDRADRRKPEAPRNPVPPEWAIGRLRRAQASRTVALSAAFGRGALHAPIAIMDIRAWVLRGAAAPRVAAVARVVAEVVAPRVAAVAAARVVAVVVADIDRSERCGERF